MRLGLRPGTSKPADSSRREATSGDGAGVSLARVKRPVKEIPARALQVLRGEGISGLRQRGLDATVYRHLIITARSLDDRRLDRDDVVEPPGVDFSFLGLDSADDYASLRPDSLPVETNRRLTTGQLCLIGRRGGEIVHARWFSEERLESSYLGLSFELPPDAVYAHDVFTARSARKLRISVSAAPYYEEMLRHKDVRTILGSVWPGNSAGLAMVQAHGHERVGTLGAIRLGRARIAVRHRMPAGYIGAAGRFPG